MSLQVILPAQPTTGPVPQRVSIGEVWDGDVGRLLALPRVQLGVWPTPITPYSQPEPGEILIKRDDLSGWGRGGAKARKLEHLLGHLVAQGYDELITVAGNVTNLAFDLLPALDRYHIQPTLFIQDDPPTPAADRDRIFAGMGERVRLLGASRVQTLQAALAAYRRSRRRGGRPFLLLPGVSHPAGVIGNACSRARSSSPPRPGRRWLDSSWPRAPSAERAAIPSGWSGCRSTRAPSSAGHCG